MPSIAIDTAVSGNQTLVAAQGVGKYILIVGLNFTSNGSVIVSLLSGTTPIWKTYATATAGGGIVLPDSVVRELQCLPNQALVLNLSSAVGVSGNITYSILGG